MKTRILLIASLLYFGTMLYAANKVPTFVPQPESVVAKTGNFALSNKTKVFVPQAYLKDLRPYIQTKFQSDYDLKVQVLGGHRTPSSNYIFFEKIKGNKDEAYTLDISSERVLIQATNYAGLFDALQTSRQAIEQGHEQDQEQYTMPCMVIKDAPRFAFRGIMLDVSRHFQTKEFVKVNVYDQHPEIVKQLTAKLKEIVLSGRSTPGHKEKNDVSVDILKENQ